MKYYCIVLLSLLFLIGCNRESAITAEVHHTVSDRLSISYGSIRIEQGQLHYQWSTVRDYGENVLSSPSPGQDGYDKHESHIWLTPDETKDLEAWATQIVPLFPLVSPQLDPSDQNDGPLTVVLDGKTSIIITGNAQLTPENIAFLDAIGNLHKKCEAIVKRRRMRTTTD